jgi:hypothetical protein
VIKPTATTIITWEENKHQEVWQHGSFPKTSLRKSIIGVYFFEEATVNGKLYPGTRGDVPSP